MTRPSPQTIKSITVILIMLGIAIAFAVSISPAQSKSRYSVTGKTSGLHPQLRSKLRQMARSLRVPIKVISGCRKHGSKRAPRSWHRRAVRCRAADLHIAGSKARYIRWWKRHNRTYGIGTYRRSPTMLHVDVRPRGRKKWRWK